MKFGVPPRGKHVQGRGGHAWNAETVRGLRQALPEADIDRTGVKLDDILVNATTGEDLQVVRAVDDRSGWENWRRLPKLVSEVGRWEENTATTQVGQTNGAVAWYQDTDEKVKAHVSNKVAMAGLVPMGIGDVDADHADDNEEVDVVSMSTQCHACSVGGHLRTDCPTAFGKGVAKGRGKGEFPE